MTENKKSIDDYRRNIYLLKTRIAEEEEAISKLREEYSPYNLLEEESEQFKLRAKILEVTLEELNRQQAKLMKHPARNYYILDFAVRKLIKACEIMSVTPEMVFRAADRKQEKVVARSDFETVLKQICHLVGNSVLVIAQAVQSVRKDAKGTIPVDSWEYFLECFMIKKQSKLTNKSPPHEDAYEKMIEVLRMHKILPEGLWTTDKIDLAEFLQGLLSEAKELTVLEAVSIYYKLNPQRNSHLDKRQLLYRIKERMNERGGADRPRLKGL